MKQDWKYFQSWADMSKTGQGSPSRLFPIWRLRSIDKLTNSRTFLPQQWQQQLKKLEARCLRLKIYRQLILLILSKNTLENALDPKWLCYTLDLPTTFCCLYLEDLKRIVFCEAIKKYLRVLPYKMWTLNDYILSVCHTVPE